MLLNLFELQFLLLLILLALLGHTIHLLRSELQVEELICEIEVKEK